MNVLDIDAVKAHLRAVIAEAGPNYVYPQYDEHPKCRYANDQGRPDCGVARVLVRHGMPEERLSEMDAFSENGETATFEVLYSEFCDIEFGFEVTPEAAALLNEFQTFQDTEVPWGEAFDLAQVAMERWD